MLGMRCAESQWKPKEIRVKVVKVLFLPSTPTLSLGFRVLQHMWKAPVTPRNAIQL